MRRSFRESLAGIGRWPRLLAALACLLLAAVSAVDAAHGAPATSQRRAPTASVVVAARDLPAGRVLTRRDLAVERWPTAIRPPGSAGNEAGRVGERLAGPVRSGEAVTATRTVGPSLIDGLPTGVAAIPVAVAGRAVDLVRPGEHVELLATASDDAMADINGAGGRNGGTPPVAVIAPSLVVLAVLPGEADDPDAMSSLVVAADRSTTIAIARRSATSSFTAVPISP